MAGIIENLNTEVYNIYIAAPPEGEWAKYFIERSHLFFPLRHRKFSFLKLFQLYFFVLNNKIELIHSHGFGAGCYSRLLSLSGLKVIHTFHGIHIKSGTLGFIKYSFERLFSTFVLDYICVSVEERECAINACLTGGKEPLLIENAPFFLIGEDNLKETMTSAKVKLGTLSRFDQQKGIDLLIKHFSCLLKSNLEFHLYIAGDGEKKDAIKELILKFNLKEHITLLGNISDVEGFLNMIDFYVSSSRGEGLPLAPLEAMLCKVPVFLSDVCGHRELVPIQQLFELESSLSFTEVALKLANLSDIEMDNILLNQANTLREKYNIRTNVGKHEELYEKKMFK